MINLPADVEAPVSTKRETTWAGYTIHLTETCGDDTPSSITDVATTSATTTDNEATAGIHDRLGERGVLPREHIREGRPATSSSPDFTLCGWLAQRY